MNDHSKSFQKKLTGFDWEFAELLWRNGNPLIHSPSPRRLPASINEEEEEEEEEKEEEPKALKNPILNPALEDEMSPWFQYPSFELLEKELASDFFCDIPSTAVTESTMPPPKPELPENRSSLNFPHFSRPAKFCINNRTQKEIQSDVSGSSSMITMGSGTGETNQVATFFDRKSNLCNLSTVSLPPPQRSKEDLETRTETYEATGTSSSGGSVLNVHGNKRKGREVDEAGSMSEEGDYESADGKKPAQRYRRSRAAEVHNLSERRRRDRINEKMKALQELIPNCTKTDKASMLDEAIEYLKSLQLQLQIMCMGSGMGPMMFPGNLIQLPRIPMVNRYMPSALSGGQMPLCPQSFAHLNIPNQMLMPNMSQSYAPYLGFHHLQPPLQAMSLYYESQMRQQQQQQMHAAAAAAAVGNSSLPHDGVSSDKIHN